MVNLTKDMTTREVLEALFDEAGLGEAQFYKIEPGDSDLRIELKKNFNKEILKSLEPNSFNFIKMEPTTASLTKDLLFQFYPNKIQGMNTNLQKENTNYPGAFTGFPNGENLYLSENNARYEDKANDMLKKELSDNPQKKIRFFEYGPFGAKEIPLPVPPPKKVIPLPVPIPSELLHKRDYYQKYGQGMKPGMVYDRMDDNRYDQLMQLIREAEGGYVDNKNDPGGKTNFGVSENTYPNEDIKNLTRERAELLLYRDFYKRFRIYNISDDRLAGIVLSMAINHDLPAIQRLHTILGIKPGTIIGPATMKALENKTEEEILEIIKKYKDETKKFFLQKIKEKPKKQEFQNGWMNRVDAYSY